MKTHPGEAKVGAQHRSDTASDNQSGTFSAAGLTAPSQIELLLKTVETELIPRLFVSHFMDVPATSPLVENLSTEPATGPWGSEQCIAEFAQLCIGGEPEKLDKHVTDLLATGVTLESIFLYLLAPTANYLGDQWLSDKLSFVDVHLGLCRLHQLICECETIGYRSANGRLPDKSILLSCAPGDDHTFGVTMVADFFRRYGWRVSNLCGLDTNFLVARLASTHYSAIGFSLHNEYNYEPLTELIRQVRASSVNSELLVMVGGDYFIRNPDAVNAVGADIFATDGREAVLRANKATERQIATA